MCNKIDANLMRFSSVQGIVIGIQKGEFTREQGLFYLVNLLGNQLLAVVDDVNFYEECKEIEENIEDYIGKVAFTTVISPYPDEERGL